MQGKNVEKGKSRKFAEVIWSCICLAILVSGAGYFLYTLNKAPQSEWRNAYTHLPWKSGEVVIAEASAGWKTSAGDERMELRAYCYPECRILLSEAPGTGTISIHFCDTNGHQIGDRVNLAYTNGSFTTSPNFNMKINGKEAIVRLEDGFQTPELYKLHQVSTEEPLWRVYVEHLATDGTRQELGHLSVLPHDL